jgi:hypothetical protein
MSDKKIKLHYSIETDMIEPNILSYNKNEILTEQISNKIQWVRNGNKVKLCGTKNEMNKILKIFKVKEKIELDTIYIQK